MSVLCPALRCHPGVTLLLHGLGQVPGVGAAETNPREQKRRGIKFPIPKEAKAQTRRMLGKKAQVNPQVCPTPPSLDTPPPPFWGGAGATRLWHGEPRLQADRRRKANKETPSSLPQEQRERLWQRQPCRQGTLSRWAAEARWAGSSSSHPAPGTAPAPRAQPSSCPGDKGHPAPSRLRGQAQPRQDGPCALETMHHAWRFTP